MQRINLTLPEATLTRMNLVVEAGKRSQFVSYAVMAMLERLVGTQESMAEARMWDTCARGLVYPRVVRRAPTEEEPA